MELGYPVLILWANVPVCCWKMPPLWGRGGCPEGCPAPGDHRSFEPDVRAVLAQLHGEKLKSFGLIIQKASPGQ